MTPEISAPVVKKVPTNLNGKFDCETFLHLQIGGSVKESDEQKIFQFVFEDKSHPPVNARVYDSIRQPLKDIHPVLTRLSHNMERQEFISKTLAAVKNATLETEVVAYFYRKHKE